MQEGSTYLAKSNHCFIRTTPGRGCKKHPVRFAKSWSRGRAQHHSLLEAMGAQGAQGILRSLRHTALVSAVSWQCLEEVSRASLNTWLVHLFLCGSNAVCKNRGGETSTPFHATHTVAFQPESLQKIWKPQLFQEGWTELNLCHSTQTNHTKISGSYICSQRF